MTISGDGDIKSTKTECGIKPKILNEVDDVQNLTRSSRVQSNASIIMGKGAPVTIRTNAFGDFEPSHQCE